MITPAEIKVLFEGERRLTPRSEAAWMEERREMHYASNFVFIPEDMQTGTAFLERMAKSQHEYSKAIGEYKKMIGREILEMISSDRIDQILGKEIE